MTNALQVFSYEGSTVRTIEKDGEPWFVAKDVADILGIQNIRQNMDELDDDEKGVSSIYTPGGNQDMTVITESGVYALVFKSRKPEAKEFSRWVRREVLPEIRKTGAYVNEAAMSVNPEMLQNLLDRIEEIQAANDELREQLEEKDGKTVRRTRGAISGASQIIEKALACESEDDYKRVLGLDRIYQGIFGFSALEVAGFMLGVKLTDYVSEGIETGLAVLGGLDVDYMFKFDMPAKEDLPKLKRSIKGDTKAIEQWKKYHGDVFKYDD